jgi:hypothetical protein
MINYSSVRSTKDYKNYMGGDAATNDRARSHVYPAILTKFGKLTVL